MPRKKEEKAYFVEIYCSGFMAATSRAEALKKIKNCKVGELKDLEIQGSTVDISARREEWYDELLTN